MSDGLFWAAKLVDGQIVFYRDLAATPGAAIYREAGIPYKYLKIQDGSVQAMDANEIAAVDAAEAQAQADANAAQTAQDAAQQAAEAAAAQAQEQAIAIKEMAQKNLELITPKSIKGLVDALISTINTRLKDAEPITVEEVETLAWAKIATRIDTAKQTEAQGVIP